MDENSLYQRKNIKEGFGYYVGLGINLFFHIWENVELMKKILYIYIYQQWGDVNHRPSNSNLVEDTLY